MEWRLLEGVPAEDVRQLLSVARRHVFRRGEVAFQRAAAADQPAPDRVPGERGGMLDERLLEALYLPASRSALVDRRKH